MRVHDQDTLVIRVPLSKREHLLESYPEGFGVPQLMCDWPGRGHCSRAFRGYPQTGKPRSGAAGATRVGVEVATRVAGSIVPLRRSR